MALRCHPSARAAGPLLRCQAPRVLCQLVGALEAGGARRPVLPAVVELAVQAAQSGLLSEGLMRGCCAPHLPPHLQLLVLPHRPHTLLADCPPVPCVHRPQVKQRTRSQMPSIQGPWSHEVQDALKAKM